MSSFHGVAVWILNTNKVNSTKGSRTLCPHRTLHARTLFVEQCWKRITHILMNRRRRRRHRHSSVSFRSAPFSHSVCLCFFKEKPGNTMRYNADQMWFFLLHFFRLRDSFVRLYFSFYYFFMFYMQIAVRTTRRVFSKMPAKAKRKEYKMQTSEIRSQVPQVIQRECWRRRGIWKGKKWVLWRWHIELILGSWNVGRERRREKNKTKPETRECRRTQTDSYFTLIYLFVVVPIYVLLRGQW